MSWITDKLLGLRAVFFGGEQLPERGALEFAGAGVDVEDDAVNKRTKVTVAATLTSITGAAPIVSSGGATPQISITAASGAAAGSMSAAHYTLLSGAAEASTPSTLAQRTSAGALRGDWFEADGGGTVATTGAFRAPENSALVGRVSATDANMIGHSANVLVVGSNQASPRIVTVVNGSITLAHGATPTTFAQFLSSGACSNQTHLRLGSTRPRIWVSGPGDTPLITPRDAPMEGFYTRTVADAQGSDTLAAFPITGPMASEALVLSAYYVPIGVLTANDTNYATLTASIYSSAGALTGTAAESATQTVGALGTGNWTARVPVEIKVSSPGIVAAGSHIEFAITKTGTGVVVPAGLFVVRYILIT